MKTAICLAVIFFGEGLMIAVEAWAGQKAIEGAHVRETFLGGPGLLRCGGFAIAGAMLMLGYFYGAKLWGIWPTSAVSVISILIMEPVVVYAIFRTMPGGNVVAAFVLGGIGLVLTLRG